MITKERVEELLDYDPLSGIFHWRDIPGRGHRELKGKIAGCLAPSGYVMLGLDKKLYRAHRVVFLMETGSFPIERVDHINGIKKDNRRGNLRLVTQQQNLYNSKVHKDSTTGVKGVSFDKERNKYVASIYLNGKSTHLGYFENLNDADIVSRAAREKHHGIYARHK